MRGRSMEYDVKDIKAADAGRDKVEWAERRMPVLRKIRERFKKEKPLKGVRVSCAPYQGCRLREETGPLRARYGEEHVGVQEAPGLPGWHRGGHLPQARLRPRPLHLVGMRGVQTVPTEQHRLLQPSGAGADQAGLCQIAVRGRLCQCT